MAFLGAVIPGGVLCIPVLVLPTACFSHSVFLLLQDYICPQCESGFIEELPEEPR